MVRVKSDCYTKAAVKAPRKQNVLRSVSGTTPKNNGKSGNKYSGGNSYCLRPTPGWQKPITNFFSKNGEKESAEDIVDEGATCSSANLSEDAPGCSKDTSIEDAPGCSKDTSSEDAPGCSKNSSIEDAPGCIKDTSEPIEDGDMSDQDSDEESMSDSNPKGKKSEGNCNGNHSNDDPEN